MGRKIREELTLPGARALTMARMIGSEASREDMQRRLMNLPARGDMDARLTEIRKGSRVRKCDLEEALRIVQFLTLADVWDVMSSRLSSAVLPELEDRAEEAALVREKGAPK